MNTDAFNEGMDRIQKAFLQAMSKGELQVYYEILQEYSDPEWDEGVQAIVRLPYQFIPSSGIMCKILDEIRTKNREKERADHQKAMTSAKEKALNEEWKPLSPETKKLIAKITGKWNGDKVVNMPKRDPKVSRNRGESK